MPVDVPTAPLADPWFFLGGVRFRKQRNEDFVEPADELADGLQVYRSEPGT